MRYEYLSIILFLFLLSYPKSGFSYYFSSETLGQLRITQNDNYEFPFHEYLFIDVDKPNSPLSIKADLDLYGEPYFEEGKINLHQASMQLHSMFGLWDIALGRIKRQSFEFTTLDGINLNLRPVNHLLLNAYSGAKRFLEKDGFLDANFVAGSELSFLLTNNFSTSVKYEYETDSDGNNKSKVGGSAFLDINAPLSPRLYSLIGYEAKYGILENLNFGLDIWPANFLKIQFDGSRYDVINQGIDLNSVMATFAKGPISEIGELIEISPTNYFSIYEKFSYLLYEYETNLDSNGINLLGGINFYNFLNNSNIGLSYFYLSSYGGVAYGGDFMLKINPIKKLSLYSKLGLLSFDKITSEVGNAASSRLAIEYSFGKIYSIELNGEYNSNNELLNDGRVGFRVNVMYF